MKTNRKGYHKFSTPIVNLEVGTSNHQWWWTWIVWVGNEQFSNCFQFLPYIGL